MANFSPYKPQDISANDPPLIGTCPYFETILYKPNFTNPVKIDVKDSFVGLTCVRGEGEISGTRIARGESVFIPAQSGEITLTGEMEILTVSV